MVNYSHSYSSVKHVVHQKHLEDAIHAVFPSEEICTHYRGNPSISVKGNILEIDVYIPKLNLCFEFQDAYHFETTWYYHFPLQQAQERDKLVNSLGLTLIDVPLWWNANPESLIESINFQRPDLLQSSSNYNPISFNPPPDFLQEYQSESVGQLMLASFIDSVDDVGQFTKENSWWMGEKYDGVRVVWNGFQGELYTRRSQKISLLPSIKNHLFSLDSFFEGEAWFGRGRFNDAIEMMFGKPNWSLLRCVAFDNPAINLHQVPFEKRYHSLLLCRPVLEAPLFLSIFFFIFFILFSSFFLSLSSVSSFFDYINVIAPRIQCPSKQMVSHTLKQTIEQGGEGIILRKFNSLYEHGRSSNLLKLKTLREEAEALVISFSNGSVQLKMPSGIKFLVEEQDTKLRIGDVVTIEYDYLSHHSIPVSPYITRVRDDLSWENVLFDFNQNPSKKGVGYAASYKKKNMRTILEELVKNKLKLDPLVPDTWYSLRRINLVHYREAHYVMTHFEHSYVQAVLSLFPELNLDAKKFVSLPQRYFKNEPFKRKILESAAKEVGFDPLVPNNWLVYRNQVLKTQRVRSVLPMYENSLGKALHHLFPEIGFDVRNYLKIFWPPVKYWSKASNRRHFFIKIAKEKQFDPLISENWYSVTRSDLLALNKEASMVLEHHNNDHITALIDLFPKIGFERDKFVYSKKVSKYWKNKENRRKLLDEFAIKNNFDPLDAESWNTVPILHVLNFKGMSHALFYHKDSLTQALTDLYPDMKGEVRIRKKAKEYTRKSKQQEFFMSIAKHFGFNYFEPEHWLKLSTDQLTSFEGAAEVLGHHNYNLLEALSSLFGLSFKSSNLNSFSGEMLVGRVFFNDFATKNCFDPLVASNWYSIPTEKIFSVKGSKNILQPFKFNILRALKNYYPETKFDEEKFIQGLLKVT